MIGENRLNLFDNRYKAVIDKANKLFGVNLYDAPYTFNLRGRVAGWASCKICNGAKQISFRFNRDLLAGNHFDDMLKETLPHEIAHGVCFLRPDLGKDHDDGWRRVCIALGGNGNKRHNFQVTYAGGSFDYVTTTGKTVTISKHRHTKIQTGGMAYRYKDGGRIFKNSPWCISGQGFPEKPKMPTIEASSIQAPIQNKSIDQNTLLQQAIENYREARRKRRLSTTS